MDLKQPEAEIYVPDGVEGGAALARTTHMAIGAHQDDLEIMAFSGILECFQHADKWFTGVVVTNGAGSPRDGIYGAYTDDEMIEVRRKEQRKAAVVGEYAAQVLLDFPSSAVKNHDCDDAVEDLAKILAASQPEVIFTHNITDKHDTHVGVVLKLIKAIRSLPAAQRPKKVYGCEVWRDLDWLNENDKVPFDCSEHENLQAALVGVFDSQIAGGKRYDLATMGRRKAHATYHQSHGTDATTGLTFAMDLTPLIEDTSKDVAAFAQEFIQHFADEVANRFKSLTS